MANSNAAKGHVFLVSKPDVSLAGSLNSDEPLAPTREETSGSLPRLNQEPRRLKPVEVFYPYPFFMKGEFPK